ncbi:hypothetical protein NQ317_000100 [Molorchus minor]|uniref:3'-5' exonuclease domain-containing protein n=1 Tax=Molorchus minor TaxID=1323400 RepID=A0ABQ9J028_9CUCU|nr:hypothetical protein NQ317_000100 [Molorchus minor]
MKYDWSKNPHASQNLADLKLASLCLDLIVSSCFLQNSKSEEKKLNKLLSTGFPQETPDAGIICHQ